MTDNQGNIIFTKVEKIYDCDDFMTITDDTYCLRIFSYQYTRYAWSDSLQKFVILNNPDDNKTIADVIDDAEGILEHRRNFL